MKVILTRDADIDIDGILEYSLSTFGRNQAEKYFLGLKERIEKIANGFVSSTDYSHVREGLKRTNYESHAIYYCIKNETVIIFRVLNQKQDTEKHIN